MMEYTRDIHVNASYEDKEATIQHVRDHLAAIADSDDDPTTRREDVEVELVADGDVLHVRGFLDAEPDAPYLKEDFEPFKNVNPELMKAGIPDGQD
jgi:hypothetical protein